MTHPPFILLPDTNAFCDILLLSRCCCCDGNNADVKVFLDGVVSASVVTVVAQVTFLSENTGDSAAADSSVAKRFENYHEIKQ